MYAIWGNLSEKAKKKNTKMRNFQISILKCFLDNFPNMKYLIYSTCSLFPSENEEVVKLSLIHI